MKAAARGLLVVSRDDAANELQRRRAISARWACWNLSASHPIMTHCGYSSSARNKLQASLSSLLNGQADDLIAALRI